MPETSMKVTEDTVTVSALKDDKLGREGQTVQLKDADLTSIDYRIHFSLFHSDLVI